MCCGLAYTRAGGRLRHRGARESAPRARRPSDASHAVAVAEVEAAGGGGGGGGEGGGGGGASGSAVGGVTASSSDAMYVIACSQLLFVGRRVATTTLLCR